MHVEIPSISIVIPTCNRKDSLKECLLSLAALDYPKDKHEVIVIDDGSTDGTQEMLSEMVSSLPFRLKYRKHQERKGISSARNLGMKLATGEIYIFTDDDCLFEKQWLTSLTEPFSSHKVGIVGGPDRTPKESSFFSKCVGYLFTSFVGTGGLRRGRRFRLGRYYPKGCNMAVRADAISKVGEFNEDLGPSEEIELGFRIRKKGYRIGYEQRAFVWHKRKTTLKALLQKVYRIGFIRFILARKYKDLLQVGHMIPPIGILMVLLLSILSFISSRALNTLIVLICCYVFILLISGIHAFIQIKDFRALIAIPFLIPLHHSSHGVGFLIAAIKNLFGIKETIHEVDVNNSE